MLTLFLPHRGCTCSYIYSEPITQVRAWIIRQPFAARAFSEQNSACFNKHTYASGVFLALACICLGIYIMVLGAE